MSEILLISPRGMLGRAFRETFEQQGRPYEAVSHAELDITQADQVERAVREGVRYVINCAAYTDVDLAEQHEDQATAVNATGVQRLAQRCRALGAVLVHYSTDYVFNGQASAGQASAGQASAGEASAPYRVDEPRRPQNAYGRSKARGEELLLESGCEHLLVRTSWVYAAWGKNFVDTIARAGRERPSLRVVNDQRGRPTSARYLAERSLALLDHGARGIFHVTDGGECTWYEFACAIVAGSGGSATLEPCTSAEYARPAKRPSYSVLDLSKTDACIGPSRPWQDNLADVLREREALGASGA